MASSPPVARVAELRDAVEAVSHQLVALLNQRARLVAALMEEKRAAGMPPRDPERERQLVARLGAASDGPLDEKRIARVFAVLFAQALEAVRDE